MLTINTYNNLSCDDNLKSPIDKHLGQNRPAVPHPLVSYRDPLGEGNGKAQLHYKLGEEGMLVFSLQKDLWSCIKEGEAI